MVLMHAAERAAPRARVVCRITLAGYKCSWIEDTAHLAACLQSENGGLIYIASWLCLGCKKAMEKARNSATLALAGAARCGPAARPHTHTTVTPTREQRPPPRALVCAKHAVARGSQDSCSHAARHARIA